jgi:hypothetical protein
MLLLLGGLLVVLGLRTAVHQVRGNALSLQKRELELQARMVQAEVDELRAREAQMLGRSDVLVRLRKAGRDLLALQPTDQAILVLDLPPSQTQRAATPR